MSEYLKEGEIYNINDIDKNAILNFKLVVDRLVVGNDKDFISRVADSVELSFYEEKEFAQSTILKTIKKLVFQISLKPMELNLLNHLFIYLVSIIPLELVKIVMDLEKQ